MNTQTHPTIAFNPNETAFKRRMADGHYMSQGHALTGYYVDNGGGIYKLVRTCGC